MADGGGVLVRAAGAVPWTVDDGQVRVLVIHRPRYDDWTFPKGKCDPGETDEACARREVWEETRLLGCLDAPLTPLRYVDNRGRDKVVHYWEMPVLAGAARDAFQRFVPNGEVDEVRWVSLAEAIHLLSYERDRELLRELLSRRAP